MYMVEVNSTLMMEAEIFSETLVSTYHTHIISKLNSTQLGTKMHELQLYCCVSVKTIQSLNSVHGACTSLPVSLRMSSVCWDVFSIWGGGGLLRCWVEAA
jgi:hypothetical protein